MDARARAEYKRRRTVAIKRLRELGVSEAEIQDELAKMREDLGTNRIDKNDDNESTVVGPSEVEAMETAPSRLPAVIPRDRVEPTPQNGRDWSKYSAPERRCIRIKRNGEQCKNSAIKGSTVCMYHGGAAKHVRESARARLENASDRMAKELLGMAVDPNMTPQVKLAAIRDALDRGGLKPPTTVEVSASAVFEEIFTDIVSGSREAYRQGLEADSASDDPLGGFGAAEVMPREYSESEYGDYQHHSHPAPAMSASDSDPLRSTDRGEPPRRDGAHRRDYAVTGEDAIRLANQANLRAGTLRALPPGRSG